MVTAKNVEVQQSRVSLANFIDETQAELKTIADRLKVNCVRPVSSRLLMFLCSCIWMMALRAVFHA